MKLKLGDTVKIMLLTILFNLGVLALGSPDLLALVITSTPIGRQE